MDSRGTKPQTGLCVRSYDFEELRRALAVVENHRKAIGVVNPRPPGLRNHLLQAVKKSLARSMQWYTRPLQEFHASLSRSLMEVYGALEHVSANMITLDEKLVPQQQGFNASVARSLAEIYNALEHLSANMVALDERLAGQQLDLLHEQVRALISLENTTTEDAPASIFAEQSAVANPPFCLETRLGNDRTTYILGLFGSGRLYVNELLLQHIGERAKYFRDELRVYPGPTSMICSGHVTVKYVSRGQALPAVMRRIAEAVKVRFADSIFVYRHPLDSLLTNWVYWRNYVRDNREVCGISEVYESSDDLCADLDRNFFEFRAFAEGYSDFYAGLSGPRFLSFSEYVEESALHYQSASLALRLEDFMVDPVKDFSRIVELISADVDPSGLVIAPPRSKPYGYLAVREKVPRFRNLIDRLDVDTRRRIDKLGYTIGDSVQRPS